MTLLHDLKFDDPMPEDFRICAICCAKPSLLIEVRNLATGHTQLRCTSPQCLEGLIEPQPLHESELF